MSPDKRFSGSMLTRARSSHRAPSNVVPQNIVPKIRETVLKHFIKKSFSAMHNQ